MASNDYWHSTDGFSNPPAYNAATRFDERQRQDEQGVRASMAFASSRAVANEATTSGGHDGNGAGVGAGRNAYMAPDTPSMYTDPYEYASNVGGPGRGANVLATRPGADFLEHDPYPSSRREADLHRSNTVGTLAPGDSISAYNVDAPSRDLGMQHSEDVLQYADYGAEDEDGYRRRSYRDSQDQYHSSRGGTAGGHSGRYDASAASLPLKEHAAYMGYADDEEDEKRKREEYWNAGSRDHGQYRYDDEDRNQYWDAGHQTKDPDWDHSRQQPPSLFANNMSGPNLARKSGEEPEDVRHGLLSAITGGGSKTGARPGWGGTLEEQIDRRRNGVGRQRWPILSWILSVAYVIVFIVEMVKSKSVTGQAIQTKPSINPMIGPPFEFLINFGARFVPCMRSVPAVPLTTPMICLKDTALSSVSSSQTCPLYEICGLPDATSYGQSYRFITPIFIHAGIIHLLFNLLAQLTLGSQIEKIFSTPVFALVYVAGGIGGNLLGGNFGLVGLPSVGASGAIYACISMELTDLLFNWRYEHRPMARLIMSIVFTIIGFGIGLLPGLDNFAHIGGFAVGILGGCMLGPSIHETRRHRIITWVVRIVAAALLVGFFVGLATNFYNSADPSKACTWCRYLSCLPTFSQCKGNGLTVTTTSN